MSTHVGFGMRLVAALIDLLVITVVLAPVVIGVTLAVDIARGDESFNPRSLETLGHLLLPLAVVLFWRYFGATPGKMAVGARIVDAKTGAPPSTGRLVIRLLAYLVSLLPFYLGFFWVAVDKRKQGWHDKIAGTVVVYED